MLNWIISSISKVYALFWLNSSSFIIMRSFFSLLSAFIISLWIGPIIIKYLHNFQILQIIRSDGPSSHMLKKNIPTMGGIIMLISVMISIIMWSDLYNIYVWYILFTFITYGCVGAADDLLKIKKENSRGLSILNKLFFQSLITIVLIVILFKVRPDSINLQLVTPFFRDIIVNWNIFWYMLLAYFVCVGMSNAVNLSDGLDGLAIVPILLVACGLSILAFISSSEYFSVYLNVPYISFSKELIIICAAIIGSSIGFLWFNTYPAQIFMGDIGSLSFGGVLGVIAMCLRQECLLLIMSIIFVIEFISVVLQVSYFKCFKRRIFYMAPIHHHFELKGYPEPKIIVRFWIVSLIFMLFSLVILIIK